MAGNPNYLEPVNSASRRDIMNERVTSRVTEGIQSLPIAGTRAYTQSDVKLVSFMPFVQRTTHAKWLTLPVLDEGLRLSRPSPILLWREEGVPRQPFIAMQRAYYAAKHVITALQLAIPHLKVYADYCRDN